MIIKQIPIEEMTREERQAALNEVKVLSMLNHPNIIAYYDSFLEDKALMICMEYAQGNALSLKLCFATMFTGGTIFEYLQNRGDVLLEEEVLARIWDFNFFNVILGLFSVGDFAPIRADHSLVAARALAQYTPSRFENAEHHALQKESRGENRRFWHCKSAKQQEQSQHGIYVYIKEGCLCEEFGHVYRWLVHLATYHLNCVKENRQFTTSILIIHY